MVSDVVRNIETITELQKQNVFNRTVNKTRKNSEFVSVCQLTSQWHKFHRTHNVDGKVLKTSVIPLKKQNRVIFICSIETINHTKPEKNEPFETVEIGEIK